MKKNNLLFSLISLFAILSLSSCDLSTLDSILNQKYSEFVNNDSVSNNGNNDVGSSIELLDSAFNAKVDKNGDSLLEDFSDISYTNEFENASRVNITENTLSLDYCDYLTPSSGEINGLVIPVEFPDARAKKIETDDIIPNYQSVSSYYYNTSYGKLNMHFDVLDWQMMPRKSSYYEGLTTTYYGDAPGASAIIYQVLGDIEDKIDLTKYDNDNDGVIDSLYIIYSTPVDSSSDLWWAFQYTVYETKTYDGVEAGYYVFAGYDFLFENDENCNTSTFIHESGHMFGLEDYYDYDSKQGYSKGGVGGADMMDYNIGDHNAFSKLSTGWVNNPILVDLEKGEETIITIDAFSTNGDCIILCDNYDSSKGMFQDYFLLELMNAESRLNKDQLPFTIDGIRVYRIHAELENFVEGGTNYTYYKYDNSYTNYNLIDAINNNKIRQIYSFYEYDALCANNSDLFIQGDSISNLSYYDNIVSKCSYGFEVMSIENNKATLNIFKK